MKKKSLTKRLVSFITAVGLTLTSTVMLIPASAEDAGYTKGTACVETDESTQETCTGIYDTWETNDDGWHQLVCTVNPEHVYAESLHEANTQDGVCALCDAIYTVTIAEPENGTVEADVETAEAEDIVTLTVTPAENYEVETVSYTAEGGEAVPVNAAEGVYSFEMPAANVIVTATFKATVVEEDTYTVTIAEGIENGTITVEPAEATTDGVAAETEVTLTVKPASENYEIAEVSYTAEGGDKEVLEAVDGAYKFTMPAANVTVSATFNDVTPKPTLYTVTVNVSDEAMGTATSDAAEDGVETGTEVTLTANANPGYQFKEWTVVSGDVTVTDNKFTMGTKNVEVTAVFEAIPATAHTVTVNNVTGGTITATPAETAEDGKVAAGTKVVLTATADDTYAFANEYAVADVNGSAVTVSSEKVDGADVYYFLMPASDVTVTGTFYEKQTIEWTTNDDGSYTMELPRGMAKGDVPSKLEIDLTDILAEGKEYADITSVSVDVESKNGVSGVVGIGAVPYEGCTDGWTTANYAEGTDTYKLTTPNGVYDGNKLEVQLWWSNAEGSITVSNVTIEYKEVAEEPEVDVWVENEDGSYTLTAGTAKEKPMKTINFADYLDDGKTAADVESISVDFEVTGSAGGCIGVNQGTTYTGEDGNDTNWVQVSYPAAEGNTVTLELDGGLGTGEAQIQVWWANEGSTITFGNIEIAYKVKKYTITVDENIANGSIELDRVFGEYEAGEYVYFSVNATPAEGYRFDDVFYTYVNENGDTVTGEISSCGIVYEFDMPAADIVITAKFVKEDYTVTVTSNSGGDASFTVNGEEAETAKMGDIVGLEATPTDGMEFVEWKVIKGDVTLETAETESGSGYYGEGDTYFIMPAEDVEIEAFFKEIGSYIITVTDTENGTVEAADSAKAGEEVTFTVEAAEGYEVDQVTYSYEKLEGGVFGDTIEADEDGNYTFTMPAADVTINVTYTAIDYDVRVVTAENGTVTTDLEADEETGVATANVYDLVTITVTPDEGYQLVEDSLVVTDEMDTPVEITVNEDGTYSFEMPASDVTIEAEFEAIDYTITVEKTGEGEVEVVETANIKDVVTITATPDGENVVKSIKVTYANGEETVEVETTKGEEGTYTFEMPAANVTVTVVFDMFVFEIADADDVIGSADTWEEIAALIEDGGVYTITVNSDYTFGTKFALPKNAQSLTFTGEGTLTFTGTKLVVPVDTTFDVKVAVSNKTNLIDISVAKDVTLTVNEVEGQAQFINKLTGTKTSAFVGVAEVNNIATFAEVNGNVTVNGGKATAIAKLIGTFAINGDKATAAITEVADESTIVLTINGTVIPKVTVDTFGKAVNVMILNADGTAVELASGTTILYSKNPIPTDDDSIVIENVTENGDELTAYYYAKTKEIKAEYGEALTLTYGEGDTAFEKSYPNFDLLFADITDNTVAYTIEVGTDLTLDTKFALPKKAKSITFDGEGVLTFTGTKLAVPYNVTIGEGITIKVSNKKNEFDIAVAKDATLTTEGEIEGINKLSGTKTSTLVGNYAVKNLATFKLVDGYINVDGGKVTGVITLDGGLMIGGAKATAAITTITPDSEILLVKVNNVLPKVTIEGVGGENEEDVITVTVLDSFDVEAVSELESGTTILYTKKADYTGKIEIGNDSDMNAYLYGKEIKAEFAEAVTVDNLNTTGDDENADLEKDYQNLEAAVAAINAAKDNTANYEITINKDIAPVKFDLPKTAASVSLVGDDVTINIGKATSITANTDLAINGIAFVTTGKTLTINAKKNLAVNELYGNVTAIKGGAKSTLTWVSENEATALVDITGFGTVEVRDTLTIGKNFNVTKLVLGAEDSATTLVVSNVAAKASIKALDATKGGAIEYAEGAKIALAFTGKDADFVVAEDGLTITGAVANGQAVLATDKVATTKLANGVTPANPAVEYGFVKVGKNICYMGKVLEVTAVKGEEPVGDEVAYALWSEVIAAMSDAEADYVITLLDDYNADGAIKLPKAGSYKSVTIKSDDDEYFNFNFTGNLTFTAATVISNVNIGALKNGAPAKYTINAGKNDITITDCETGMLTSVKGAKVNLSTVSVGKVTADALNLGDFVVAKDGVTTKALSIAETGAKLSINQGKKLVVNGDVTIVEAEDAKGLEIVVLDKKTGEAATLKNGEVIATVKGEGYANITLDQTAHEGVSLEYNKGKLVVTGGVENEPKPSSLWTENNGTYTFTAKASEAGTTKNVNLVELAGSAEKAKTIKSVSVDVVILTQGDAYYANGCIGATNSPDEWKSASFENPTSKTTLKLDLPNGPSIDENGEANLQLQIWWANADTKVEFSNIKIGY